MDGERTSDVGSGVLVLQPYDLTVSSVNCETLGNKIALDQVLTRNEIGSDR